jgi:hypothetical protein
MIAIFETPVLLIACCISGLVLGKQIRLAGHYRIGNEAKEKYAGNPWALSVFTPGGGINFDRMLYFPNQNYPTHGYGGTLQPIS